MIRVDIEGDELVLELSPWEKFWAIHGNVRIPLDHITAVRIEDENGWKRMFAKLMGTNAPPFKIAGIYFGNGGLIFCDYADGKQCLVVDTAHERYNSVIVQLTDQDPRTVVQQIESRIKAPQ